MRSWKHCRIGSHACLSSLTDNFSVDKWMRRQGTKGKARSVYANQSKYRVFTIPPAIMKCARDISQSLRAARVRRKNAKQDKKFVENEKRPWDSILQNISRADSPRHKHSSIACKNVLGLQIFHVLHSITKCGRTRDFERSAVRSCNRDEGDDVTHRCH